MQPFCSINVYDINTSVGWNESWVNFSGTTPQLQGSCFVCRRTSYCGTSSNWGRRSQPLLLPWAKWASSSGWVGGTRHAQTVYSATVAWTRTRFLQFDFSCNTPKKFFINLIAIPLCCISGEASHIPLFEVNLASIKSFEFVKIFVFLMDFCIHMYHSRNSFWFLFVLLLCTKIVNVDKWFMCSLSANVQHSCLQGSDKGTGQVPW